MKNTFYITTPIYYPNAKPHIGSIYSTVIADIIARYQKFLQKEVFFLTGLDEHGQKVDEAAKKKNIPTQQFVDELAMMYQSIFSLWNIQYNIFMRTTSLWHEKAIQDWIINLQQKGYIYKSNYNGWYSTSSESFLTEKDIEIKNESGVPLCPITHKPAEWISQEAYFFRLSDFENKLLTFFEQNPHFIIPKERTEEIITFIKTGLRDLCISRLKKDLSWGISFPNDPDHVVYVWADALNNYITAIGYLQNKESFLKWWPCNVHIMAKDIVRFHAIYWLAFLMASDLSLPKNELVHGWLLIDNQKMSKSLGNVIDPEILLEKYHVDSARYYFSTLSMKEDSNFTIEDLEKKHNSDLCDNLSNLLQRTVILCLKKNINQLNYNEKFEYNFDKSIISEGKMLIENIEKELQNYQILKINNAIMIYIKSLNSFFHQEAPWKEQDENRFKMIMGIIANGLYQVGTLLSPIMPIKMKELLDILSIDISGENISTIKNNTRTFYLKEIKNYIFTKINNILIKNEVKNNIKKAEEKLAHSTISFDEFMKTVILVGQIEEISDIPKSDKLYYLVVNFGVEYGIRKIASGIKQHYAKDSLLNIKTIFSFNLAPRFLCGVISEGMILMAKNKDNIPELIIINENVSNGTRIG